MEKTQRKLSEKSAKQIVFHIFSFIHFQTGRFFRSFYSKKTRSYWLGRKYALFWHLLTYPASVHREWGNAIYLITLTDNIFFKTMYRKVTLTWIVWRECNHRNVVNLHLLTCLHSHSVNLQTEREILIGAFDFLLIYPSFHCLG